MKKDKLRPREQVHWRQGLPIFVALGVLFVVSITIGLVVLRLAPQDEHLKEGVSCLVNLRHVKNALEAYALDHNSIFPPLGETARLRRADEARVEPGESLRPYYTPDDWRGLILPYLDEESRLLCSITQSPYSYALNPEASALGLNMVVDRTGFALVWDNGLGEEGVSGPHGGRFALITFGGTVMLTSGSDDVADRIRFRP